MEPVSTEKRPEYRVDPVSGEVTIVAPLRASRPNAMPGTNSGNQETACPFCRGSEGLTPATINSYPADSTDENWQVRVVNNLYPAVDHPSPADQTADPDAQSNATGFHEVIIECPEHRTRVSDLPIENVQWMIDAYRDRMRAHKDHGCRYTQVFKNDGLAAGASLAHAHSQIVGLNCVPPKIEREVQRFGDFANNNDGDCLLCKLIDAELNDGTRVVFANDDYLVHCPFASRLPYELAILPRTHQAHFWQLDETERQSFARTLYQTVSLLEKLEKQLPFNYLMHTAPFDIDATQPYHWHLELLPRLARQAGFEWGTGLHLNPVAPEAAAAELKRIANQV